MDDRADESPPCGYALHVLRTTRSTMPLLRIFLRSELSEALTIESAREEQRKQEELLEEGRESGRSKAQSDEEKEDSAAGAAFKTVGTRAIQPKRLPRSDQQSPDEEIQFIQSFEEFDPALAARLSLLKVLRGKDVLDAISRAKNLRDDDNSRKELDLLGRIVLKGAYRPVRNPGTDGERWACACRRLEAHDPQFRSVTQLVKAYVALASDSLGPLRVPPILLVGPPGVGKTHYAMDLAEAMGLPCRVQSMESVQSPALFLGSERHWSTSGIGIIFDQVALGEVANPVIVVDEIDKTKGGHYEPINVFHSLLEPRTAATARDAGLDLPFDASLVIYIATANDVNALPLTIRSRFKIFTILPSRGADALDLAHVVATEAVEALRVAGFVSPQRSFTKALAHLTAREIKKAVQEAVGAARAAGRRHLELRDVPADLLEDDSISSRPRLH